MSAVGVEKWLSVSQIAEHLGVSKETIYRWVENHKGMPCHKIGKLWKFKTSDVDVWMRGSSKSDKAKSKSDVKSKPAKPKAKSKSAKTKRSGVK